MFCGLIYDLPWRISVCLRKECTFCYYRVLKYNYRSYSSLMFFKSSVSLLTFGLVDLYITENGALKFPIITVLLSSFPFNQYLASLYFGALLLGADIFENVLSSERTDPLYHYITSFFVSWNSFWLCLIKLWPPLLSCGYHLHGIPFFMLSRSTLYILTSKMSFPCRQQIVGLKPISPLCFWLESLMLLHLK